MEIPNGPCDPYGLTHRGEPANISSTYHYTPDYSSSKTEINEESKEINNSSSEMSERIFRRLIDPMGWIKEFCSITDYSVKYIYDTHYSCTCIITDTYNRILVRSSFSDYFRKIPSPSKKEAAFIAIKKIKEKYGNLLPKYLSWEPSI